MYNAIRKWGLRTVIKSFMFNYRYWGFVTAFKLPVIVGKHVCFNKRSGTVMLHDFATGSVQIGVNHIGIFDKKYSRTVLEFCEGSTITFGKNVCIGQGCKISVQRGGHLRFDDNNYFTAETIVVCAKKITFSEGNLVSWYGQFMDSDLHSMQNARGETTNPPAEIFIGPNNWFGSHVSVFKGTRIGSGNVIGANTCIYGGDFSATQQSVLAGNPAQTVKTDIGWSR